ncbi:FecR domain-containing protein [Dongia sp.]|uniref:FecR family protein n=1 Tax=Dongia sp. TaxID=1977262 RepID=UPI0034A13EED
MRPARQIRILGSIAALITGLAPELAIAEVGAPAGVAGAVSGTVGLISPAKQIATPIAVNSGDGIVMGDGLSTGADSRLQVMLLDESAITLGPDAQLTIDEFVFDPANTNANALSASLAKGVFRLVTGAIARQNPDGTTLTLPNAVLTIRGTTVIGACAATCVVALSGSGDENNVGKKPSVVTLKSGKSEIVLKRAGFYVEIGADGEISTPQELTEAVEARFASLFTAVNAPGDGTSRDNVPGPQGGEIILASGQSVQDGGPLAHDQRDFDMADRLDGNDTFEATSNLPINQVRYYTDTAPIAFGGASGGGNYGIDYTLNLAERSFTGNLLLNCATCTAGAFTTTIPLLVSPFDNGFHLVESGFVLDPTTANDTFHINYVIGADNIGAVVQYDVDGSGATAPSTGTGVAPIVP